MASRDSQSMSHAASAGWEDGTSHLASGWATTPTALPGAAGAAAGRVRQLPTGQSLSGFSDAESLI
jgi:hypothetical protein